MVPEGGGGYIVVPAPSQREVNTSVKIFVLPNVPENHGH